MNRGLTKSQAKVALLISKGFPNKEIAAQLSVCEGTIKQHARRIFRKSGLKKRLEIALQIDDIMRRLAGDEMNRELTKTELMVAELVAKGLINREIADRMFITEGTVKQHVASIFRKCGFKKRIEIASWLSQNPVEK